MNQPQILALATQSALFLRQAATIAFVLLVLTSLAGKSVSHAQTVSTSANYPAFGQVYQFEFGALAFKNDFSADGKQMTFTRLSDGRTGTVRYTALEVRPNLFWNYWVESDGTSVARVEDFEQGLAFAIVHFSDGKVINLKGTFKKIN